METKYECGISIKGHSHKNIGMIGVSLYLNPYVGEIVPYFSTNSKNSSLFNLACLIISSRVPLSISL